MFGNDKTLTEAIREADAEQFPGMEIHPAWRAIVDLRPNLIGVMVWRPGLVCPAGFAWDWEIALSMMVRGYGDDVRPCPAVGGWRRYLLPPLYVAIDDGDEDLPIDLGLMAAMRAIYEQRQGVRNGVPV